MKVRDLEKILDATEAELSVLVKKAAEDMSKVHQGEETAGEKSPDVSVSSPSPDASASAPATDAPPAAPDASAGAPTDAPPAPAAEGSPAPGEGDPAAEGSAEGPMDPQQLTAEYAQMDVESLQMHYMCVKEALASKMPADPMGAGAPAPGPDASAGAPPMAAPGAAPGGPAPGAPDASAPPVDPMMGKSEQEAAEKFVAALSKSESEVDSLRKEVAAQAVALKKYETEMGEAAKAVETFLRRPERLAVTALSDVAVAAAKAADPTAGLSKAEIVKKLNVVARNPALKKSEREAITAYTVRGVGLETIKHLLAGA